MSGEVAFFVNNINYSGKKPPQISVDVDIRVIQVITVICMASTFSHPWRAASRLHWSRANSRGSQRSYMCSAMICSAVWFQQAASPGAWVWEATRSLQHHFEI